MRTHEFRLMIDLPTHLDQSATPLSIAAALDDQYKNKPLIVVVHGRKFEVGINAILVTEADLSA